MKRKENNKIDKGKKISEQSQSSMNSTNFNTKMIGTEKGIEQGPMLSFQCSIQIPETMFLW